MRFYQPIKKRITSNSQFEAGLITLPIHRLKDSNPWAFFISTLKKAALRYRSVPVLNPVISPILKATAIKAASWV